MNDFPTVGDPLSKLQHSFEQRIAQAVKSLLESKHLYQNITLEYEDLVRSQIPDQQAVLESEFINRVKANWRPLDNADRGMRHPGRDEPTPISFQTPDVKLFCQTCDRIEAFNSISNEDFLQRDQPSRPFESSGQTVQLFVFSFLCQSCKAIPEIFMVRRQGLKLTNSGRSPMEQVDVPSAIPKAVQRFYSGAVVAHQSGQTLAGIFLLRTLIEQWARCVAPNAPTHADQVLDAYMGTLPEDFKGRFPSFRSLYEELSADVHAAKDDAVLFERTLAEIVVHFEARLLFKL